jgi:hypothetical protein
MGCNSTKDALTPVAPESKTQSSGTQQVYNAGGPDKMFISLHQNATDIPLIDADDDAETAPFPGNIVCRLCSMPFCPLACPYT